MPQQLLDFKVDFTNPGAWFFFVTILILLPYWYFHESAEVQREFSRLYREIAKEDSLKSVAKDWVQQFERVTAFFNGGIWFAISWANVLVLACGVIFLHGSQDDNIRRVVIFSATSAEAETLKTELQRRLPKDRFDICDIHPTDEVAEELRKLSALPVLEDLQITAPTLTELVKSHVQRYWPGCPSDVAIDTRYLENEIRLGSNKSPRDLGDMKIDYVLEKAVEYVFSEHIACIVSDGTRPEHDYNRIIACIYAGAQRRTAQKWIGGLYLSFCVFCVLFIKEQKSKAFGRMQRFSEIAASVSLEKHRATRAT